MPDLAVIIVSWNVRDLLRDCLRGVEASLAGSGISYEVLVVDNASTDNTPAMVRASFPHVRLIETGRNLGFAAGNNVALRELLTEQPVGGSGIESSESPTIHRQPPTSILLLNPDTVPQGDALAALVRYLDAHPELAAVGPQLRYGDDSVQSSRRRFPTMATFFWESTPLERFWPQNPWSRRYHCDDVPANVEQRVGWLVGAALLVRSRAIQRAGLLDEGFFMYSEELEWQLRIQHAARNTQNAGSSPSPRSSPLDSIVYLPSAVVTHYEGRSSEQVLAGRHIFFQQSKLRLARMMYGSVFAFVLRFFLFVCYLWEIAVETAKLILGHRRELRRQRIGVYAQVLRGLVGAA